MPQQVPANLLDKQLVGVAAATEVGNSNKQLSEQQQALPQLPSSNGEVSAAVSFVSAKLPGDDTTGAPVQQQRQINCDSNSNGTNSSSNCNNAKNNQLDSVKLPATTTKLNGLKNRIIQRPPPLILDNVRSNFYDNESSSNSHHATLTTSGSNTCLAANQTNIRLNNDNVNQHQQPNTNATNCNRNPHPANTNQADEIINNVSYNNTNCNNNGNSSANHKFWASLNENASRNKVLANARTVTTATNETYAAVNNKPVSKAEITDLPETLGADLIITHRNSSGVISSSRIVPSLSVRRQLHQQSIPQKNVSPAQAGESRSQTTIDVEDISKTERLYQGDSKTTDENQLSLSNLSNENEDNTAPNEIDGGNLVGVEHSSPTGVNLHQLHEHIPTSAIIPFSKSNNPFLLTDDGDSLGHGHDTTQLYLHKRPASFIAATNKPKSNGRILHDISSSRSKQILEERFSDLDLDGTNLSSHYSSQKLQNINPPKHDTIFVEQQVTHSLDLRDSHNIYQKDISKLYHNEPSMMQPKNQPIYDAYESYASVQVEPAISIDSESAVCQPPPSATMQLPHWTDAIYELNNAILETSSVGGGAENGQFIFIIESGDIILELDRIKVSGFTLIEFNDLVESKQFHLLNAVQTKHSHGLTIDLRSYLNTSFPKISEDKQLQNLIRENIYRRTIPCTTRPPKPGEVDKVDYHFLSRAQFVEMSNREMLLECGIYSGHYYGTLKPLCDLASLSIHQQSTAGDLTETMQKSWDANHPALEMNKRLPPYASQASDPINSLHYENQNQIRADQPLQQVQVTDQIIKGESQTSIPIETSDSGNFARQQSIVAVDSESLPSGWERVIDQTHGTYYIDHNTQRTQYERPYEVELTKGAMGFGFTLVETDGCLLLVRSIIQGGPAHRNGLIKPGDVLISALGISVAGLQHTDIARLFSNFAVGDRVRLTFGRGAYALDDNIVPDEYLFSNGTNGGLAIAVDSEDFNCLNPSAAFERSPHILVNQEFELISVSLKRGDQGFGFTISDSMAGQRVRKIQNNEICANLKQGDVLVNLNGEDITKLTHKEVVERLKKFSSGQDVTLTVKRKKRFRSKTPMAMHTDVDGEFSLDITPQRNCRTPSFDDFMLRKSVQGNSKNSPASRVLFPNATPHDQPPSYPLPPTNVTRLQTFSDQKLPCDQLYGQTQQVIPQPIYGINLINQQNLYYNQLPPPVAAAANETDLSHTVRPASIRSFDGRENMTSSVYQSDSSLPIKIQSDTYGLGHINQYNNFMNNDRLIMMQMQQQGQQQYLPNTSAQMSMDYQHIPLYSNCEMMQNEILQVPAPIPPAKPPMNSCLRHPYTTDNYHHNYYANNEEINLQRAQYGLANEVQLIGDRSSHYGVQPNCEEKQDDYEYHQVDLDRENTDSNWGIRLIGGSEVERAISIGSIVFGGAAFKNGKLKSGDEIISINGVDVVGATHQHVVGLISTCTNRASLVVRRKKFAEACDVVLTRNTDEGFGFVIISSGNCALIGRIIEGSPADRCQQLHVRDRIIAVNDRYITPDMQHPEIVNMIKECGSTLRLRIIPVDCYTVELIKSAQNDNFGFSMRGGSEYYGAPLYILRVAPNGLARDLLNVGDQIIEINNIPTVGMTHQQAATIIKFSDPIVKLKLRRNYVTPPSLLVDSPRALQKFNQVTAEMKTVISSDTPNNLVSEANSMSSDVGSSSASMPPLLASNAGCSSNNEPSQQQLCGGAPISVSQDANQPSNLVYNQSLPLYAT